MPCNIVKMIKNWHKLRYTPQFWHGVCRKSVECHFKVSSLNPEAGHINWELFLAMEIG